MAISNQRSEEVTFRLEPELKAAIEETARLEHRTLSDQMRQLVAQVFQSQRAGGRRVAA
jgi:hypothetical protein